MRLAVISLLALSASASLLQEARPLTGWRVNGPADASKPLTVMFSMKTDIDKVKAHLERVSKPGSPEFREWSTSVEETAALRNPASAHAVRAWLAANKIADVTTTPTGDVVTARLTVHQAEALFSTTILSVTSSNTGKEWHHAGALFAPDAVVSTVDAVFGLHGKPLPPRAVPITQRARAAAYFNATGRRLRDPPNIGPGDLRSSYSVSGRGSGSTKVRQAVAEFQGQFANPSDLQLFFQNLVPYAQPGDDQVYAYKGNQATGYGIEALLDIQYIMGVSPGIKTEFWGWQNFDFCSDLKNWTSTILNDQDPPLVFSVSYGWQGDLGQIGCTASEVTAIDNDFATIANRGISIIFASGDSGSAWDGSKLWPSWPASSPYVTAVGSTTFTGAVGSQEGATTQFGSGSGFSAQFSVGSWQRRAVTAYLQSQAGQLPPSGTWSQGGRATADVSALGEGFQVYVQGSVEIVGGTSASTPTFSGIISLFNDKQVAAGGKALGYLNPWIYEHADFFTDITVGSDKIDRGGNPLQYGFNTAPGWDPPTGFGTPIYSAFKP